MFILLIYVFVKYYYYCVFNIYIYLSSIYDNNILVYVIYILV